jgi:hypothetical protein
MQQQKHHHSLRNIIYRTSNGKFNVEKLKSELQKPNPFDDEEELAQTLAPSLATLLSACLLIVGCTLLFLWFSSSLLLKWVGYDTHFTHTFSQYPFLASLFNTMMKDWHYFIMVPICLPTFMLLIYFNWLFMNFFQYN